MVGLGGVTEIDVNVAAKEGGDGNTPYILIIRIGQAINRLTYLIFTADSDNYADISTFPFL